MKSVSDVDVIKFKITPVRERFYNEDSSWGVFDFVTEDDIPKFEYYNDMFNDNYNKKKYSTLVGKMQKLYIGSNYEVNATLEYNEKYNSYQYNSISIVSLVPKSFDDSYKFLRTITSETLAKNILDEYPNIIQDVVDGNISQLEYDKIKGLGEKSWNKIKNNIIENYVISDIIIFLQPLGISFNMIKKLINKYSNPSLLKEQLDKNPYILTSINGLGFKRVDQIALKLQPQLLKSKFRLISYIRYYLSELANNQGHTYATNQQLKSNVTNNVKECIELYDELIKHNDFLVIDDDKIGLKKYKNTEDDILNFLTERVKYSNEKFVFNEVIVQESITEVEKEQGFNYTSEQLDTIKNIINDEISILSGKGGTGKTSIMRGILRIYEKSGFTISCCALAAKAAKRITEATGYYATTIHSLLVPEGDNGFFFNKDNPLTCDLLFLDEASMLNADLFKSLLYATKESTRIIICGDHKQLPPIGYANIFSDLLLYDDILSVHELKKVLRQAEKSGIISDGNKIRDGINPISTPELKIVNGELHDMYYMFRENRQALQNIAIKTFVKTVKTEGVENVQIVVPRKSNCINSTQEINRIIQDKLIPNGDSISNGIFDFKIGAKVRQTKNNKDKNIYNGDIGYIDKIYEKTDSRNKKNKYCDVLFYEVINGKKKKVTFKQNELNELDLSYAMTCHSCQGSGYKTVIGIVDNTHYTLLDNCMLYTMITRAKNRCLLLGEPNAFLKCINTNHNERNTWLKYYKNN